MSMNYHKDAIIRLSLVSIYQVLIRDKLAKRQKNDIFANLNDRIVEILIVAVISP